MLDIPMCTTDKFYFTTTVTRHWKTTIKSSQYLLPEHNISVLVSMTSRNREYRTFKHNFLLEIY